MTIDSALERQIRLSFDRLNTVSASRSFPPPTALTKALEGIAPPKAKPAVTTSQNVDPQIASLFATAAIDMWLRSVHSFLISTSLTSASPIWASVAGYYSSHYAVRATAHILGHFQLFHEKFIVKMELVNNQYVCSFQPKNDGREHQLYWKLVKATPYFSGDPLYTTNESRKEAGHKSDAVHREKANYADHLSQYPSFIPLNKETMKNRIDYVTAIRFSTPPIPDRGTFPNIEAVQVLAYHRLVKFRKLLDDILGSSNRFWNVHRTPSWTAGLLNFQLVEQGNLSDISETGLLD